MTSIALLVGTTSLALLGCQSSPAVSSTAASKSMIDFSTADSAQSQAQGRAFNASLTAKSERYQQLLTKKNIPILTIKQSHIYWQLFVSIWQQNT
ncbi:hypothetical protein [Psychrobacter sp. WY6]|uniref:hypothetical protein n=1 Tax=Psychrobacter sp. WY6 TaxID=2708350 RepID=UPI002022E08D|nr:hypothetical protein [Psychrobacter sp. WY6]